MIRIYRKGMSLETILYLVLSGVIIALLTTIIIRIFY